MKQMVNAFSEYARAPDMKVTRFPLNALVTEVADLYRVQESARATSTSSSISTSSRSRPTAAACARSSTTSS